MENYYNIKISKVIMIVWIIISIIFLLTPFFLVFIVPICYYFILKNCKYKYNNEKMIVETGVFNKKQFIIPLYRIINITVEENIFKCGKIYIQDKGQTIILKYCKNAKQEMLKLSEYWDNAKKHNIRNELI